VFRGGFRREAAEAVTGATLAMLSSLVDKSLLRRNPSGRYNLHELLRQFGEEKLGAQPEHLEHTRDCHARHCCQYLARQESRLKGADHQAALKEITEELDNIRAAWRWAAARGDTDALDASLGALWVFVASRGSSLWAEQEEELCGEIIEALERHGRAEHKPTLDRLKVAKAAMNYRLGQYERSQAVLREAIAFFRQTGAVGELAFALHHLAAITHVLGDYAQAQKLLHESIALSQSVGDVWLTAYSLNDLGLATHLLNDHLEAEHCCLKSLELFEGLGDPRGTAYALGNLGVITLALGRSQRARQLHLSALALSRENTDRWAVATGLLHLGDVALTEAKPDEAWQLTSESLRLSTTERIPPVALKALTRLAAQAADAQPEQALSWLSLVLVHPATSSEDWMIAQHLHSKLEETRANPASSSLLKPIFPQSKHQPAAISDKRLPVDQAAARLEVTTLEILGG
jgi:tetratricopeptide (TPR) repeat protein